MHRSISIVIVLILTIIGCRSGRETVEIETRRIPNRFQFDEIHLEKIEGDSLEMTLVDSALDVYFATIKKVITSRLDWYQSEIQEETMETVWLLQEITMIPGDWGFGTYGVTYPKASLKEDLALWKSWCSSKRPLLGWDKNQQKVYNKFFRNNTDLAVLVMDRYFEILHTAIEEQPFFPATGGEGKRFVAILSAMENITGIQAQCRPASEDSSGFVDFKLLPRDISAWENWYHENLLQLKWDMSKMWLVPANRSD